MNIDIELKLLDIKNKLEEIDSKIDKMIENCEKVDGIVHKELKEEEKENG